MADGFNPSGYIVTTQVAQVRADCAVVRDGGLERRVAPGNLTPGPPQNRA